MAEANYMPWASTVRKGSLKSAFRFSVFPEFHSIAVDQRRYRHQTDLNTAIEAGAVYEAAKGEFNLGEGEECSGTMVAPPLTLSTNIALSSIGGPSSSVPPTSYQNRSRRVSYVLPASMGPLPILNLPPEGISKKGHPGPLFTRQRIFETGNSPAGSATSSSHTESTSTPIYNYSRDDPQKFNKSHLTHRLAVQALALDLSTLVAHHEGEERDNSERPGGILYSAGRDGLLCSWELNLPTKRRKHAYGHVIRQKQRRRGEGDVTSLKNGNTRFARMDEDDDDSDRSTGEATSSESSDDSSDEEENVNHNKSGSSPFTAQDPTFDLDDMDSAARTSTDGVHAHHHQKSRDKHDKLNRRGSTSTSILFEDQWEIDADRLNPRKGPPITPKAKFRQCIQSHTDWVNDILLCNYNRTLISASSDSLILAWNPHSSNHEDQVIPKSIGRHGDYVRCLASPRASQDSASSGPASWVASGGFDRKILLWDIAETRTTPIIELPITPSSIYCLSTTSSGGIIAAGSPERTIRCWDPRSRKQVARLSGGHADNVRAVLLADDGKWLLSASSDCTVKLWSLAAQKCLHTFSHHSSSVWSLFSQHPNLEIFYSGDRQGNLCKVDFEGIGDPEEGECVVLARDTPSLDDTGLTAPGGAGRVFGTGITQMVAQDDCYVWTAGGTSSIKRWKDVPRRSIRRGLHSLSMASQMDFYDRGAPMAASTPSVFADESTDCLLNPAHAVSSSLKSTNVNDVVQEDTGLDTPAVNISQPSLEREHRSPPGPTVSFTSGVSTGSPFRSSSNTPSPGPRLGQSTRRRPSSLRASFSAHQGHVASQDASLNASSTVSQPLPHKTALFDVPYESLVPLTDPDDLGVSNYVLSTTGGSRMRDADSVTGRSVVPHSHFQSLSRLTLTGSPITPSFKPRSVVETPFEESPINPLPTEASDAARREFMYRESASEAIPLWDSADDVIEGGLGLVRCELLNDRRHALTLDTSREVALWDIIEGGCIGLFSLAHLNNRERSISDQGSNQSEAATDGSKTTESSSLQDGSSIYGEIEDVLEYVKERVEGEVSIASWCKIDIRVGTLTVHLEENSVFDAEIYADEAHLNPQLESEYPPEHRLSLGKWVLRHLFADFIEAELEYRIGGKTPSHRNTLKRASGPSFISLPTSDFNLAMARAQPKTPGMTIALATPAAKRAVLPDMPSQCSSNASPRSNSLPLDVLQPIPQSPLQINPSSGGHFPLTPGARTPTGSRTPTGRRAAEVDYFSMFASPSRTGAVPLPAVPPSSSTNLKSNDEITIPSPSGPAAPPLPTPGGTLMGRLRLLGKASSKRGNSIEQSPLTSAAAFQAPVDVKTNGVARTAEEEEQHALVEAVTSQPLTPCPLADAPPLPHPSDMAIIISEETNASASWAVTYRGLVSTGYADLHALERTAPFWLLDFVLGNRIPMKDPIKIPFVVLPWKDASGHSLPDLPGSNARLTANRHLRIAKVASYAKERLTYLSLSPGNSRTSSVSGGSIRAHASSKSINKSLDHDAAKTGSSSAPAAIVGGEQATHGVDAAEEVAGEELIEILCGDVVLSPKMTLATTRAFYWKQGGDIVLSYRYKTGFQHSNGVGSVDVTDTDD